MVCSVPLSEKPEKPPNQLSQLAFLTLKRYVKAAPGFWSHLAKASVLLVESIPQSLSLTGDFCLDLERDITDMFHYNY